MTKATYRKHLKSYLTKVIRKFGFEHPATIHFANQMEIYLNAEPTYQNDAIMRHNMTAILKYGEDFEER